MKLQDYTAISILLAFCAMAGCTDSSKEQQEARHEAKAAAAAKAGAGFDALSDDAVLVAVNGNALTKATFMRWVDLRQTIARASLPNDQKIEAGQLDFIRDQMLSHVTNDFPREVAAREYAAARGIAAASNEIQRCRMGFMRSLPARGRSWKKMLAQFGEAQRATIEDRVATEAVTLAVHDRFLMENKVTVDAAEVERLYANYQEYNAACAASNTLIWAQASNIWQRIVAGGEDFTDLADRYNEDEYKGEDAEWGTFHLADFADEPEIWRLTKDFRAGYVSPPVEGDNGLNILKVVAVEDGEADVTAPGYEPSPEAEYTIARIFLHLPLFIETIDMENFTREFKTAKETAEYNKFIAGLVEKADVRYPSGTDIFAPPRQQQTMMPTMQ